MWHLWCSDGGYAAVYGLDSTPDKGTQPAEGAQPREATYPLATQAIAEHDGKIHPYGADERSAW